MVDVLIVLVRAIEPRTVKKLYNVSTVRGHTILVYAKPNWGRLLGKITLASQKTRLIPNSWALNVELPFRLLKRSLVGDRRGELEFCSIRAAIDRS